VFAAITATVGRFAAVAVSVKLPFASVLAVASPPSHTPLLLASLHTVTFAYLPATVPWTLTLAAGVPPLSLSPPQAVSRAGTTAITKSVDADMAMARSLGCAGSYRGFIFLAPFYS
jgi:hypothetical protein